MGRLLRIVVRVFFLLVVPLAAVAVGSYLYVSGGRYVSTENAYVKTRKVAVSPDISGRVTAVMVFENQRVLAGQKLFELDGSEYEIARAEAEAEIADVARKVKQLRADYRVVQAELMEAQARLKYVDQQAARYRNLSSKGIASTAKLEEIEQERSAAAERVTALRERINSVLASLGGKATGSIEKHPWSLRAKAAKQRAALNISYTQVFASLDGIVTNLNLEEGEFVTAGQPIFVIVEQDRPWVEANLKETQLTHVIEGQKVTLVVDAYPDLSWTASVESISPATGAEFSLLPPQNASGNWVKVVQRVPVRLAVDIPDGAPPLRAGMTAEITIDTEQERDIDSIINSALAFVRR